MHYLLCSGATSSGGAAFDPLGGSKRSKGSAAKGKGLAFDPLTSKRAAPSSTPESVSKPKDRSPEEAAVSQLLKEQFGFDFGSEDGAIPPDISDVDNLEEMAQEFSRLISQFSQGKEM